MSNLHSIIYTSKSTINWTDSELKGLLNKAHHKNQQRGITGILIYINDRFIQVIEAENPLVLHQLMETIQMDERHEEIFTLFQSPILERAFPSWTMGLLKCADAREFEELSGYADVDLFMQDIRTWNRWNPAFEFLKLFYQKNTGL